MKEKAVVPLVEVEYDEKGLWIENRCQHLVREIIEREEKVKKREESKTQ